MPSLFISTVGNDLRVVPLVKPKESVGSKTQKGFARLAVPPQRRLSVADLSFGNVPFPKPPSKFPSDNFDYDKFKSPLANKKGHPSVSFFIWQGQ